MLKSKEKRSRSASSNDVLDSDDEEEGENDSDDDKEEQTTAADELPPEEISEEETGGPREVRAAETNAREIGKGTGEKELAKRRKKISRRGQKFMPRTRR